jgi:hypothetical protein
MMTPHPDSFLLKRPCPPREKKGGFRAQKRLGAALLCAFLVAPVGAAPIADPYCRELNEIVKERINKAIELRKPDNELGVFMDKLYGVDDIIKKKIEIPNTASLFDIWNWLMNLFTNYLNELVTQINHWMTSKRFPLGVTDCTIDQMSFTGSGHRLPGLEGLGALPNEAVQACTYGLSVKKFTDLFKTDTDARRDPYTARPTEVSAPTRPAEGHNVLGPNPQGNQPQERSWFRSLFGN